MLHFLHSDSYSKKYPKVIRAENLESDPSIFLAIALVKSFQKYL